MVSSPPANATTSKTIGYDRETARESRGSEVNGKQYHFIPRNEFDEMVRADEFLEHAEVFGNCYGTARRFLREAEQSGHDLLLDIDVQGARQIKKKAA